MNERWTKPRADGKPHSIGDTVECAHCSTKLKWDAACISVIRHCRQEHREFYLHKWNTELKNKNVSPEFLPLPVERIFYL